MYIYEISFCTQKHDIDEQSIGVLWDSISVISVLGASEEWWGGVWKNNDWLPPTFVKNYKFTDQEAQWTQEE